MWLVTADKRLVNNYERASAQRKSLTVRRHCSIWSIVMYVCILVTSCCRLRHGHVSKGTSIALSDWTYDGARGGLSGSLSVVRSCVRVFVCSCVWWVFLWNTRQNVAIKTFQCFGETVSQSEGATRPSFPARTTHIQTYIINGILKLSHKSRKCLENV